MPLKTKDLSGTKYRRKFEGPVEEAVSCKWCGSGVGVACTTPDGAKTKPHRLRMLAFLAQKGSSGAQRQLERELMRVSGKFPACEVGCPWCLAVPQARCVNSLGTPIFESHLARKLQARVEQGDLSVLPRLQGILDMPRRSGERRSCRQGSE